jgi:lysophospholipase L1-like esterase
VTAANLARAFPSSNVTHLSGALPATTSAFATPSIPKLIRPEADLVFVEYTVNDGWEDEPPIAKSDRAKAFERTLRTLLSLPRRPAVVLVHALPSNASRAGLPFWASEEDHYGVLAQYYDVPSLSVRDAVWHEYLEAARLLTKAQEEADGKERERTGNATAVAPMVDPSAVLADENLRLFATWQFNQLDERHPTQRGQRMMADLVIGLLQHEFVRTAVRRATAARRRGAGGGGDEGDAAASSSSFAVHDARSTLPPPMYEGNDAGAVALQCLLGKELAAVAVEGLEGKEGGDNGGDDSAPQKKLWRLVNDGDEKKPKWGLAADVPGSELVLELDTRVAGRGKKEQQPAAAASTATTTKVGDDARRHHDRRLSSSSHLPHPDRDHDHDRRRRGLRSWWSWWETSSSAAHAAAASRDAPNPARPSADPPPNSQAPLDAELWVGVTRSWRGQGSARLTCEGGGCRCDALLLRAHDAGRKVTQNYVERVPVSQSAQCRVVVRLPVEGDEGKGPDGGTRVKLVGVTVASSLPGAAEAAAAAGGGC